MPGERFTVKGPARWRRSVHTSMESAMAQAKVCSTQFPNAVCRVERGLPGLQKVVAECNRNECARVGTALGRSKRKRRRRKRR